jgi:hypothetical protein
MILETLFGMSLVMKVSLDTQTPAPAPAAWMQLSVHARDEALLPLVQRATTCILQRVAADRRYRPGLRADEINDLIVDSIAACRGPVKAMIEAHDRMYGAGSGQAFLLGPYLDVLPTAVIEQVGVKMPGRR